MQAPALLRERLAEQYTNGERRLIGGVSGELPALHSVTHLTRLT